jgi:hypothetical protein
MRLILTEGVTVALARSALAVALPALHLAESTRERIAEECCSLSPEARTRSAQG